MRTRRDFLKLTLAVGAANIVAPSLLAVGRKTMRIRTITYNVLHCSGFAETEEAKPFLKKWSKQVPTRLAFELALYEPDIVSFQEGPREEVVRAIADNLGMNYAFFKGGWNGALLTRFKIVDSQNCPLASWDTRPKELFTRHWGRALIRTPDGDLPFFSAHLHPSDEAVRGDEVSEVLKAMAPSLQKGGPVILQGDLNHEPSGSEYKRWIKAGLVDSFVRKKEGTPELSFSSNMPYKRIDYVWTSQSLARQGGECRILFERAFRTNSDDPRSTALSDHLPVMADFG